MRRILPLLVVTAAPFLSSEVAAQGTNRVVPQAYTHSDAPGGSDFPFVYDKTRVQHLVDGRLICGNTAVLFSFAYRVNGTIRSPIPAATVQNLTVTIGYSGLTAQTMSQTYATNRKGTQTTVFQGNYNLPAQPVPTNGLGTFNVVYKWNQPFIYQRSMGNFLIEFEVPGQANQKMSYPFDAVMAGTNTSSTFATWGDAGSFSDKTSPNLGVANAATVQPGGQIDLLNPSLSQQYPTLHVYGFSMDTWGPVQLPLDLTQFGAPGNMLYVAMDLLVPAKLSAAKAGWTASTSLSIPKDPGLNGFPLFATSLSVETQANALGLVFGDAVGFFIGGQQTTGMQMLYSADSTAAQGNLFNRNADGGNVLQLNGTFN